MAGRGIVGKLAVKVVPDTSRFPEELRAQLEKIKRRVDDFEVKFVAKVELDRSSLEKAKRQIESLDGRVKVKVDVARDQLAKAKQQIDNLNGTAKVKVDVDQSAMKRVRDTFNDSTEVIKVKPDVDRTAMSKALKRIGDTTEVIKIKTDVDRRPLDDTLRQVRRKSIGVATVRVDAEMNKARLDKALNDLKEQKAKIRAELEKESITSVEGQIQRLTARARNMPIKASLSREELERIRYEIKRLKAAVEVDANLSKTAKEKIKKKLDGIEGEATVNANLDKGKAWLGLKTLTRPRYVQIIPVLSASAVAKVGTALAALSGGRALNELRRNLWDLLSNLDKTALKIGTVATAAISLGNVITTLVATVGGLIMGLAQMSPALLALPGIFLGAATGAGIFFAAVKDIGDVLSDLGPVFDQFQDEISGAFWGVAEGPIRDLVATLLPAVRGEVLGVAAAYGQWAAAASQVAIGKTDRIVQSMGYLREATEKAAQGVGDVVSGIIDLGLVGAKFLPRLINQFNRAAAAFKNWAEAGANDGSIERSIERALVASRKMWRILVNTTKAMTGFVKAAAAGGYTLDRLVSSSDRMQKAINGLRGQRVLKNIFAGAAEGMDNLFAALGKLGPQTEKISRTIKLTFAEAGTAAGMLATAIANILSQAPVDTGIGDLFKGLEKGFSYLNDAAPGIARLLGGILTLGGALAANIGRVLGAAFIKLGPPIAKVLEALAPVAEILGNILVAAISAVEPWLTKFADWIASLSPETLAGITLAIGALGLAIQGMQVMQAAAGLGSFVSMLASIPGPVLAVIAAIAALAAGFIYLYTQSETFRNGVGAAWDWITQKWNDGISWFQSNILPILQKLWADTLAGLKVAWNWLETELLPVWMDIWKQVLELWQIFGKPTFDAVVAIIKWVLDNWTTIWNNCKHVISGVWEVIKGIVLGALKIIQGTLNIVLGLINGDWSRVWLGMQQIVSGMWMQVRGLVVGGVSIIRGILSNFGMVILGIWRTSMSAQANAVRWGVQQMQNIMRGGVNALGGIIRGAGGALRAAAQSIMNSLLAPIRWGANQVRSLMQGITNKIPSWKGPANVDRKLLTPAGHMVMDSFLKGLNDGVPKVKGMLNDLTGELSPELKVSAGDVGGLGVGGHTVNITNYYPQAQRDSKTRDEVAQGIALAGVI